MSLDRLSRRLDDVSKRLVRGVEKVVGDVGVAVAAELVPATPVDTGFARANWRGSLNAPTINPVSFLDPTGDATIGRLSTVARSFKVGSTIFIVNNAPYINSLNEGSSPQAPAGFVKSAVDRGVDKAFSRLARDRLDL